MRYIPNQGEIAKEMLKQTGYKSFAELFDTQIPREAQFKGELKIEKGASELELRRLMSGIASKNLSNPAKNFCGAGLYFHYVPSVVDNLSLRAEFLTSYTPYQPEISQGTLRYIFEFQSFLTSLTKMDVANASMYDGSTAFAEAILMAKRILPKRKRVAIAQSVHPEYRQTGVTSSEQFGLEYVTIPCTAGGSVDLAALERFACDPDTLAVCVQSPNFYGVVEDLKKIGATIQHGTEAPVFVVAVPEAMSLALYEPPGSFGADIICGEAQSFGNYPAFGGPVVGFFAAKEKYVRNMPGRIVGQTLDGQGKTSFCLTLSTREQHIRRDKATSNICTNQGWCALRATIYLATMGSKGLKEAAEQSYSNAHYACEQLTKISGVRRTFSEDFFNEFVVEIDDLDKRFARAVSAGIVPGIRLSKFGGRTNELLLAFTEIHSKADIDLLVSTLKGGN